jgi:hypothetical protein
MEKNPGHEAKGHSTMTLAQILMRQNPNPKEAEKLFEEVVAKYKDIKASRGTLADRAESNLFEIRNLQVGMVAPDIEGEDTEGKKFKLSDYRGKVVMLDFGALVRALRGHVPSRAVARETARRQALCSDRYQQRYQ